MTRSETERSGTESSRAATVAEPGRRGLFVGILAYRWATLTWMSVLAVITRDRLVRPTLAMAVLGGVIVWNIAFTSLRGWERPAWRWTDLAVSVALLPFAGSVMEEGGAAGGAPFFATAYPATSALTVGAAGTPASGLAAGLALSLGLVASRPTNGVGLGQLDTAQWANLVNGIVYFLAAGGAAGVVSRSLARSGAERDRAIEEAARERERAARLAERDALGREIHDSVLQALALLAKQGRELMTRDAVSPDEVRALLGVAGQQERALRELLSHPRDDAPVGAVSLRTALAAAAFGIRDVPVTVSATTGAWMPADEVDEVVAAVRQALENVERHAHASSVTIFAEAFDGEVVVSVRDDGVGFAFDEQRLARDGKMGLLRSMRGRAETLGGSMEVHSAPGRGTEIEFRFPRRRDDGHG
jgi:signal transduction histidine kinase